MKAWFLFKYIFFYLILSFCFAAFILFLMGTYFTYPALENIGEPPKDLNAENISIGNIKGWYSHGNNKKCILLLHGVKSNRTSMSQRAIYLNSLGYLTLQIDLQAHGESIGDKISFGYRESFNAKAAIQYLRSEKNCLKIGAIGVSLGGASLLLGPQPADADAIILESVYPTIEQAVTDRIAARLGNFIASVTSPLLYKQIPMRLNINLNQLHPVDAINTLKVPVFILSGTADQHTTEAETKLMFDRAIQPKQLWLVSGAKHEDLYKFSPKEYEEKVQLFFNTYLQ